MCDQEKKSGLLVEDTTVAGGRDAQGNDVIAPKNQDGTVQEGVTPTDPREAKENG